jgi:3-methyladenine DNA glycosylase AlkD
MKEDIQKELRRLGNEKHAELLQKYFKTGKGQYGEGDRFLGIKVPDLRRMVKKYGNIPIGGASELIRSGYHEERLFALLALVELFRRADEDGRKRIYNTYLRSTEFINNWDLVDASAGHIIGAYLLRRDRKPVYALAESNFLWERRISIMSTSHFIKHGEFADTLSIAERLLGDKEDLIHKAVGWMLRAIGKKDCDVEEIFLAKHYKTMPRTMLRYAIEKFPEEKRRSYMKRDL